MRSPAGVGTDALVGTVGQPQQLQDGSDSLLSQGARQVVEIGLQLQQFSPGQHLIQSHLLGNKPQFFSYRFGVFAGWDPVHLYPARIGTEQGAEAMQSGGLARSIGAENAVDLAGFHLKGDIRHGHCGSVALLKLLYQDRRSI